MVSVKNKIKKKLTSPVTWTVQLMLFGLAFGIPFFVNTKNYILFMQTVPIWQMVIAVIITIIIGILIEGYLKKVKLLR